MSGSARRYVVTRASTILIARDSSRERRRSCSRAAVWARRSPMPHRRDPAVSQHCGAGLSDAVEQPVLELGIDVPPWAAKVPLSGWDPRRRGHGLRAGQQAQTCRSWPCRSLWRARRGRRLGSRRPGRGRPCSELAWVRLSLLRSLGRGSARVGRIRDIALDDLPGVRGQIDLLREAAISIVGRHENGR